MGNIRDGKIDGRRSSLKLIDPATEDIPKFTLRRGDILFNRTNSPELVGKAAVFDLDGTGDLRVLPGADHLRRAARPPRVPVRLDQLAVGPALGAHGAHGLRQPVEHQRDEAADHARAAAAARRAARDRPAR